MVLDNAEVFEEIMKMMRYLWGRDHSLRLVISERLLENMALCTET